LSLTSPKFKVLMMAYNNAQFLRAALEPLLESGRVEEIVVVEGAWSPAAESVRSVDGTLDILHEIEKSTDKLRLFYWSHGDPCHYGGYQCQEHMNAVLMRALTHPYYDPPALQQQLLARDFGLRKLMSNRQDNDWLFIVDSDEVYSVEGINELAELAAAIGSEIDYFAIQGKNFYFNGEQYHDEWYYRLFKMKPNCFFWDDNMLGISHGRYKKCMDVPPEICEFYHYGYVGEFRVKKKLEMWRQDSVERWWEKHKEMMNGSVDYDGSPVHLFGDTNPGYSDYRLVPFTGEHPLAARKALQYAS